MTGFQRQVNLQPAVAIEGDFASANPRAAVLSGAGAFIAGAAGLTMGRFAWVSGDGQTVNNFTNGRNVANNSIAPPDGFVHRNMMGLITQFLAESTMLIPKGLEATLYSRGDFWVRNAGTSIVSRGQDCYAMTSTGQARFTEDEPDADATGTGSIATHTSTFTGVIVDNILTATGATGLVVGSQLTGSGISVPTFIVAQLDGTPGSDGHYLVTPGEQSVASTTVTNTYGIMTLTAATGTWLVGGLVTGGTATAGTSIISLGTGVGGTGTYNVLPSQTVSSASLSMNEDVITRWKAGSQGGPGELIKITAWS